MTDGIDRDHFLDYSAKSKIFNLPKHIQLLRCGSLLREPLTGRLAPLRRPAIRWSVTSALAGRPRIRGSLRACPRCVDDASGMDPTCFDCDDVDVSSGGDEETRTPDPLLAKEMLYQLSYVPDVRWVMVGVSGLEPETSALSGQCSNQLS